MIQDQWFKSSFTDTNQCVEIQWTKSTFSGPNGSCVEYRKDGGEIYVRDSKNPTGPVLAFTEAEWAAFVNGAKAGEFDL